MLNAITHVSASGMDMIRGICDPRLSTIPSHMTADQWRKTQEQLIADHVKEKILALITEQEKMLNLNDIPEQPTPPPRF